MTALDLNLIFFTVERYRPMDELDLDAEGHAGSGISHCTRLFEMQPGLLAQPVRPFGDPEHLGESAY